MFFLVVKMSYYSVFLLKFSNLHTYASVVYCKYIYNSHETGIDILQNSIGIYILLYKILGLSRISGLAGYPARYPAG